MKKATIIFCLVVFVSVNAMDDEPYRPTIPMINPNMGEGYMAGMSTEMKAYIITTVASSSTLEEAIAAIRAQAMLNTDFNTIINDLKVTKDLVNLLVDKFGEYHEVVARALSTPGAKEYVELNNASLIIFGWGGDPLEDIKKYLESGADVNYINRNGRSVASSINTDTPAAITYLIDHGINVNAMSDGMVTLVYRVLQQSKTLDPKVTKFLLSKMKPALLNYRMGNLGDTVLHMLVNRGYILQYSQDWYNIIEFLVNMGADVSIKNYSGATALDTARDALPYAQQFSNQTLGKVIELLELTEKNQSVEKQ